MIKLPMAPEVEVLLCCARTNIDEARRARIRALTRQEVDWERLLQLSVHHKVSSLIYWTLNTNCRDVVPPTILAELERMFKARARSNLALTGELFVLLELLDAHNISVIPLKGPVLAAMAYNNLLLRQFSDLDLLIHEQNVLKAKQLLADRGYQVFFPFTKPEEVAYLSSMSVDQQEKLVLKTNWEYHLSHHERGVDVDLHWQLMPSYLPFPINSTDVWEHLKPVSFSGRQVFSFSPEDLVLILCMHGAKDGWSHLSQVCDVAELLRSHPNLNWEQITVRARKLGYERILLLGLYLAWSLLEADLPKHISQRLENERGIHALGEKLRRMLINDTAPQSEDEKVTKALIGGFHLSIREHWRDKAWYCLNRLLMPTVGDHEQLQLPPAFSFLYYLFRPVRLIRSYGLSTLRHRLYLKKRGTKQM